MAEAMAEEGEENPWLIAAKKNDKKRKAEDEPKVEEFNANLEEFMTKQKKAKKQKLSKDNVIRERLEMVTDIDDLFNEASRIRHEKMTGKLKGVQVSMTKFSFI